MKRILLVDDEPNILAALKRTLMRALSDLDIDIETFNDPQQALDRAEHARFDLVISDYRMPQMDGVTFLMQYKVLEPDCPRLILSGSTDSQTLMSAVNEAEVMRYLVKPWDDEELVRTVREVMARAEQQREEHRLADQMRLQNLDISAEEAERRRLEAEDPGITRVRWGPDGEVLIDER